MVPADNVDAALSVIGLNDFALEAIQLSGQSRDGGLDRDVAVGTSLELAALYNIGADQAAQMRRFFKQRATDAVLLEKERGG
jgi:hypothetical protein